MMKVWSREFPLPRIQCGAPLGNGRLGFLLWGSGRTLHITVGCASLWDHRGGISWSSKQNFQAVCAALYAKDKAKIDEMFAPDAAGSTHHPSLIPAGRADVLLPPGAILKHFSIDFFKGICTVFYKFHGRECRIYAVCDMSCRYGLFLSGLPAAAQLKLHSGYDLFCGADYQKNGQCEHNSLKEHDFEPPEFLNRKDVLAFRQPMPADPSYTVLVKRNSGEAGVNLLRGENSFAGLEEILFPDFSSVKKESAQWWKNYWNRVPQLSLDDPLIEEIYSLGMYKYGIMTNPAGVTPGLQGPWIEDDRLPPWQGDYHFNINAQMIISPGLLAGLGDHLKPLFDMVLSWREKLRENAKCFVGIENGYMLPHAVDDRGTCMGAFWTGNIDHASTAWIAQLMFEYCDISDDKAYLQEKVFDFMCGTMRVFEKMIVRKPDGTLELPVSISPEFRDENIDAWGVNSSFQLAAIHRLARNLIKAAEWLGAEPDAFWFDVEKNLPLCSLEGPENEREIALWKGEVLRESHRHHSHLGGLVPFDVLDINDPAWGRIIGKSLNEWVRNGMGAWTGWSVPWASQICSRAGFAVAAVAMLAHWRNFFNNQTGASLHDSLYRGLSIFGGAFRGEIMQIEGACGATTAVQNLVAFSAAGELHFFYGIPGSWKHAEFRNMHLPGGVCASGKFADGRTKSIELTAARSGILKIRTGDSPERLITIKIEAGKTVFLKLNQEKYDETFC